MVTENKIKKFVVAETAVNDFTDKDKKFENVKTKRVETPRYNVTFEELKKGGAVGSEATLYENIAESIPNGLYDVFENYKDIPQFVKTKSFDSGRNLDALVDVLKTGQSFGIASGRKPSGACHFGHKLVVEALSFFQKNNGQIFMPIADLEAELDDKIKDKEHYKLLAADNILDWGACGLDLDAAHVYLQSEEMHVMQLAYTVSRGLEFDTALDIYGRDSLVDDFKFTFAGMAQVGDILLPQHQAFDRNYSFMLSGPDQDGHMTMTMTLAGKAIENKNPHVKKTPASLYVLHVPGFDGKKMSASEPQTSSYLGSLRNVYVKTEGRKFLDHINALTIDERIEDSVSKINKYKETNPEQLANCINKMSRVLPEFAECKTADDFIAAMPGILREHQMRRRDVYAYACLKALGELVAHSGSGWDERSVESKQPELVENIVAGLKRNCPEIQNAYEEIAHKPKFWKASEAAYIPAEQRQVKTQWYHMIAANANKLVV